MKAARSIAFLRDANCSTIDFQLVVELASYPNGQKINHMINQESILRLADCIFVKRNCRFVKIRLDEILYMEADGNYVHIVAGDKKFTVRLSLIQAIEKIHYPKLVRINRSAVVNIDAIQSFNKEQVMVGKREISIGKNHREFFFRQFGLGHRSADD